MKDLRLRNCFSKKRGRTYAEDIRNPITKITGIAIRALGFFCTIEK
jgi:hypothetical protein